MADPITPPPVYDPAPAPLPATVDMNPPMVGTASPFEHVGVQNRDIILESIRSWVRGELLVWAKNWQSTLTDWRSTSVDWSAALGEALVTYITTTNVPLNDDIFTALLSGTSDARTLLEGRYGDAHTRGMLSSDLELGEAAWVGGVEDVATAVLTGGLPQTIRFFDGAIANPSVARPEYAGILVWIIRPGQATPANVKGENLPTFYGDIVFESSQYSVEDQPGFEDTFTGAAGALGVSEFGRKPVVVGTRTGLGGVTFSRDGSGHAGITAGTAGNATAVYDAKTKYGVIRLELNTVVSGAAGVVFRYSDYQNYWFVGRHLSSNARISLWKVTGGVASEVIFSTVTGQDIVTGAVIEVNLHPVTTGTPNPDTVTVTLNGVAVWTDYDISSANTTGTYCGLYGYPSVGVPAYFADRIKMTPA